jgi:glycosyltransferase involved in cell wall biosynthesis
LLTATRLFALPSEHENFGLAALEALAAGTPVLLSPQVDLAAAVLASAVGYTAPLYVEAWRGALAQILSRHEEPEKAARARHWVRENYAWSHITRELARHYEGVITGSRGRAPFIPAVPVERRAACLADPR